MLTSDVATPTAASQPHRASSTALNLTLFLALLLVIPACAPASRLAVEDDVPGVMLPPHADEAAPAPATAAPGVESMLRTEVERWRGTPHVLGGQDRNGIDCSAFVQNVYDKLFDLRLPRTTIEQVDAGQPVSADALRVGDLVFFKPPTKSRHVGIYLSDGEFAHVSSSEGVTISKLSDRYWQDAYWTSRRLLTASDHRVARSGPSRTEPLASQTRVIGRSDLVPVDLVQPEEEAPRRTRIGW